MYFLDPTKIICVWSPAKNYALGLTKHSTGCRRWERECRIDECSRFIFENILLHLFLVVVHFANCYGTIIKAVRTEYLCSLDNPNFLIKSYKAIEHKTLSANYCTGTKK